MPSAKPLIAHTANHAIVVPDVQLTKDDPSCVYVPLRGYSALLAVFNLEDRCIGWILAETLGHHTVRMWMDATGWRDGGY